MTRFMAALMMVGLWAGLNLFAASPDLHHLIHPDSHQPAHECVLTLLAKGLVTGTDPSLGEVTPPEETGYSPGCYQHVVSQPSDLRLAPGRAPPAFFSPHQTLC